MKKILSLSSIIMILVLLSSLGLFPSCGCTCGSKAKSEDRVRSGEVCCCSDNSSYVKVTDLPEKISPLSFLQTGPDENATIDFIDVVNGNAVNIAEVHIWENSRLRTRTPDPKNPEKECLYTHECGTTFVTYETGDIDTVIIPGFGVCRTTGTMFRISTTQNNARIAVFEGGVRFISETKISTNLGVNQELILAPKGVFVDLVPYDFTEEEIRTFQRMGGNAAPVAVPHIVEIDGMTVQFNGLESYDRDSGGSVSSWRWRFGDGAGSDSPTPVHTYAESGEYNVTLVVVDNQGKESIPAGLIVSISTNAPVAVPRILAIDGLTVSFDGYSSYDIDGEIVSWHWQFGDGEGSENPAPFHTYSEAEEYEVSLYVIDNHGIRSQTIGIPISLDEPIIPPEAIADITWSDGYVVGFTGECSFDPDGEVVAWEWSFGDGGFSNETNPVHTYPERGEYEATLVVFDNDGAQSTTVTVNVDLTNVFDYAWSQVPIPSTVGHQLAPGTDVTLVRAAPNGAIFAVEPSSKVLYKSADGGRTWTLSSPLPVISIVDLEISPSYATDNIVILVANTGGGAQAMISYNGGSSFTVLGSPVPGQASSLAIAPNYVGGSGEVMIGTYNPAPGFGDVYIYGRMPTPTVWTAQGLNEDVTEVAFSPSYIIDATIIAVGSTAGDTFVHTKVLTNPWDITVGTGVPVTIATASGAITEYDGILTHEIISASLTFPSDFNASLYPIQCVCYLAVRSERSDDKIYRVLAGGGVTGATAMDPDTGITDDEITSLAHNGTIAAGTLFAGNAVTGPTWTPRVYKSLNPSSPTPTWTMPLSAPTGTLYTSGSPQTYIAIASNFATSNTVYCGTIGFDSALSVSNDGGLNFYQVGMIDTVINKIDDLAVVDNSELFLSTNNGTGLASIWKSNNGGTTWYRYLSQQVTKAGLLRLSPHYATDGTVLWADTGGTNMRISNNMGVNWAGFTVNGITIGDIAIWNSYRIYVSSDTAAAVQSTSNGGLTWQLTPTVVAGWGACTDLEIDPVTSHLLVGLSNGTVFTSINNTSWTPQGSIGAGGTVTTVAFDTDYATNSVIYAGNNSGSGVWRWVVGTSTQWTLIYDKEHPGFGISDLEAVNGVLLVTGTNGVDSRCWWTLNPTASIPYWYFINLFNNTGMVFDNLIVHEEKLWVISVNNARIYTMVIDIY